jgi:hypothetical protein
MFRRLLRHLQGELYRMLQTIVTLYVYVFWLLYILLYHIDALVLSNSIRYFKDAPSIRVGLFTVRNRRTVNIRVFFK